MDYKQTWERSVCINYFIHFTHQVGINLFDTIIVSILFPITFCLCVCFYKESRTKNHCHLAVKYYPFNFKPLFFFFFHLPKMQIQKPSYSRDLCPYIPYSYSFSTILSFFLTILFIYLISFSFKCNMNSFTYYS